MELVFASVAPMGAALFTHPLETIKVKLQLQQQQGIYRNTWHAALKIIRAEGYLGLQRGLSAALLRESSKNLFRIGMFQPLAKFLSRDAEAPPSMANRIGAGVVSGAVGAIACQPAELLKTRLQAQSKLASHAVGHQHNYSGLSALRSMGVREMFKGSHLSIVRASLGTASNLTSYTMSREYLMAIGFRDHWSTDFLCALASSLFSQAAMNPVDVVRTRCFNEKINAEQCIRNMALIEGPRSFWKGFFPGFIRLGPHFGLTLVFYQQMLRMYN